MYTYIYIYVCMYVCMYVCCEYATFGLTSGNRTRDPENLVRFSANWATQAVAKNMVTSSVFIYIYIKIYIYIIIL